MKRDGSRLEHKNAPRYDGRAKAHHPARGRHTAHAEHESVSARHFIFCTGIENSYPVITNKAGQRMRRDGMLMSDHYDRWREDFQLVEDMGITFLRTGPPYYRCHQGPLKYDWSFPDQTFKRLRQMQIHPITDMCHFGVPDWAGDFQNPEWPPLFADYCRAFARRFPWVRFYTPVNEIYVCARFSGQLGWWNEQLKSDRAFVTAMRHMCRANIMAEEAILEIQPDALFIQSESSEYFHAGSPQAQVKSEFYNQFRFLALDLSYGNDVNGTMLEFLLDNGMSRDEYHWFLEHGSNMRSHCVMGNDYYITNEHEVIDSTGQMQPSGEIFGYYVITKQYFDRYRLPVMHTETNRKNDAEATAWLWKEWSNVLRLRRDGVPILGFTWFSLLDQTDWDTALREDNHRIDPLGLFDLNRKIRKVGEAYKLLISQWRDELPLQSMSRDMYLTAHDVRPEQKEPVKPDVVRRVEANKRQPLRIVARGRSREQAQAEEKRRSKARAKPSKPIHVARHRHTKRKKTQH
jgi:beta-glucosidase/6-phospho-beta-glucosidase/beta-galactosidase